MATPKPKKSGKKSAAKSETADNKNKVEKVTTTSTKTTTVTTSDKPMKGFFARKCDVTENVLTIFKTPKIWGALLGEIIGTMFVAMFMMSLGAQPLYLVFALVCVYVAVVGISGAHLNPLITAGMMATRRMSAIRGILYMLAQLMGAWIGALIINAFRIGSASAVEAVVMADISGETFWAVTLVELLGATVIGFCFARALRYARRQPLTFALTVTSAITFAIIVGLIISQSYFGFGNSFAFNPVIALMYQILPTAADNFGQLAQLAGLALAAYVVFPILGGILGFFISDIATRLSAGGYSSCEVDEAVACNEVTK